MMLNRKIFSFALMALFLCSCGGDSASQVKLEMSSHPSLSLVGFRLIETLKGTPTWEFQAQAAAIYEKKNKAYAEQVKIIGYENAEPISILTADKGVVQTQTNEAEVEGHVVLISLKRKTRLETNHLSWKPRQQLIASDDFVTVTYGDGNRLTGYGFKATANLENVRVVRPSALVKDVKEFEKIK